MTKPRYEYQQNNVVAPCPNCDGAVTNFESKDQQNKDLGLIIINGNHQYQGKNYSRILWRFFRCVNCGRGATAKIHDLGGPNRNEYELEEFLPFAIETAQLPPKVPLEILKEFREAERDAAHGAHRSGSAMLRSVLEKTLDKNGYEDVEIQDPKTGQPKKSNLLIHRIDAAANDGIITESRRKRAHENIRVLGNDILHDAWREVSPEEFAEAHHYSQRILEDFYDARDTVEALLKSKNRPYTPA